MLTKTITTKLTEPPAGMAIVLTRIVHEVVNVPGNPNPVARMKRINSPVPVSTRIKVPMYGGRDCQMELVSCTTHTGSADSGHWFSHFYQNGQPFCFNDGAEIEPSRPEDLNQGNLFLFKRVA